MCAVCEAPIVGPRLRRKAKTCSAKCGQQYREAYLRERRGLKTLKAYLGAMRGEKTQGNTVPGAARATLGDEFKQAIEILSGE